MFQEGQNIDEWHEKQTDIPEKCGINLRLRNMGSGQHYKKFCPTLLWVGNNTDGWNE